jgi:hypothetical protein
MIINHFRFELGKSKVDHNAYYTAKAVAFGMFNG